MLKFVVMIVIIQLFYGAGVTMLSYALPVDQIAVIEPYQQPTEDLDVRDISDEIESTISSQLSIPVVEIGALVFHSGNLVIDLIVNFWSAIPSMITILINAFFFAFPIDAFLQNQILLLFYVIASVVYFVAFLNFLFALRSGGGAGVR